MFLNLYKTLLITLLTILIGRNQIFTQQNLKSYSYCHFKGINNDILTCDKCLLFEQINDNSTKNTQKFNTCLSLSNNKTFKLTQNDYNITSNQRTLAYLTSDWFGSDLMYMIDNFEILSNLKAIKNENRTQNDNIDNLVKNFKIIELNNLGIELISKNSFEKFIRLKVLRINSNSINVIDFSSFVTDKNTDHLSFIHDNNEENNNYTVKSQLIELDLSNNKIKTIKIENLMYFENLKILNLSYNYIKLIDMKLISIIAPHLQVFDASHNNIQKFNLIHMHHHKLASSIADYFHSLQLTFNYLLKDLIYINLFGNYLNNIFDLFSIDINFIENSEQDCSLSESDNSIIFQRNSPIHLNIKNNAWKCDCLGFNFIISIIDKTSLSVYKNETFTPINSCFINFVFKKLNIFSIGQHQNIESIKNLNCVQKTNETQAHNWYSWYKTKCLKHADNQDLNAAEQYIYNETSIHSLVTKFTSTISTSQVNLDWTSNLLNTKFMNSTKSSKHDMSTAFYWVSSVCIAIVTISCLFVAWFYCWKRYRLSHRVLLDRIGCSSRSNSARNPASVCRNSTTRCMQRRNVYLINSRLPNDQQQLPPTEQFVRPPSSYWQNSSRHSINQNRTNRNVTGLYYISLNRNSTLMDAVPNFSDLNVYNNFCLRDDEPPNYYEAISIKNNKRYSLNKQLNRDSNSSYSRNITNTPTITTDTNTRNVSPTAEISSIATAVLNINNNDDTDSLNGQSTDV